MRIQHNVMAMNAYRNYSNNTSALSKNLERLSSGYKINRAGDDAAGLAISEKMRAQITGLEAAQKNVKDGISLVNTAEGAMQEVQDMLNRMVYLAQESANGTYDNAVDRANLQKELDQLNDEIDRIADSANFNGIKLLDGSLDGGGAAQTIKGMDRILEGSTGKATGTGVADVGTKTILDGGSAKTDVKTEFTVNFGGMTASVDGAGGGGAGAKAKYSFDLSGVTADAANMNTKTIDGVALTFNGDLDTTMGDFVTAYNGDDTKTYSASWDATTKKLTLEAKAEGAVAAAPTTTLTGTQTTPATNDVWTATATLGGSFADGDTVTKADGTTLTVVDDATGTGGDTSKITVSDANALGIDDLQITFGNATAVTGYTITGDGTKEITFTADNAGAVGSGTAPGTAPTNGDLPTITAMGGRTVTWTLTNTTPGADESTTAGAAITATEDVAGADPAPGGGGPANMAKFDVTLNGKTIATDVEVADKATAKDIAAAVLAKLADSTAVDLGTGTYTVTDNRDGTLKFVLNEDPTEANIKGNFTWDIAVKAGAINGAHTGGTTVTKPGSVASAAQTANTVFEIKDTDITDGTKITLNGKTVTLAVGKDSTRSGAGVVDLKDMEAGSVDLDIALGRISQAIGDTKDFIVGVNNAGADTTKGLTVQSKGGTSYDTIEKLAAEFEMTTTSAKTGKGLTLQIGDTSDSYNQLTVSIGDIHAKALGTRAISIADQKSAAAAVDKIKAAINTVSSIRGTLGATSNRLDHTANNLSVMRENITDAESSIRDTDIAEEMMSYTKNNILVQSAQAMLAQANQVPQGVLQLLQ